MSKKIFLQNGQICIVDDEDFEKVCNYNWYLNTNGYARTYINPTEKLYMHHIILEPKDGFIIDHINQNTLDNRKENLRYSTHSQNHANAKPQANNTTGYKGVTFHKASNKYRSYIKVNGKQIHLGFFKDIQEAAKAYDKKAKELFQDFAYLNFPEGVNNG